MYHHLCRLGILFLLLGVVLPTATSSQAMNGTPIQNPVVYIGTDGNAYIVSANENTEPIILTNNTEDLVDDFQGGQIPRHYNKAVWSPNGQRLIMTGGVGLWGDYTLFMAESGKSPEPFIIEGYAVTSRVIEWMPDNETLLFFGIATDEEAPNRRYGLHSYHLPSGEVRWLGGISSAIGEAPIESRSLTLRALESGNFPLSEHYYIQAYANVIYYVPDAKTYGWGGVTPEGTHISEDISFGQVVFGETLMWADMWYSGEWSFFEVDDPLATLTPLDPTATFLEGQFPLGISADESHFFYMTREDIRTIELSQELYYDPETYEYSDIFSALGGDGYYHFYTDAELTLWMRPLDSNDPADAQEIFTTRGYDFGVFLLAGDDNPIVFSVVTSGYTAIEALNNGATLEDVRADIPHIELYSLDRATGEIIWQLRDAQQASYSAGEFIAIPAE